MTATETKTCNVCRVEKPVADFYVDRSRPSGLAYDCKPCHVARTGSKRALARRRGYKRSDKARRAQIDRQLRRYYGIGLDDWHEMLMAQDGRCGACGSPLKQPCVDHCHTTGQIRGLLCHSCNRAEGLLGGTIAGVRSLLEYLEQSEVAA